MELMEKFPSNGIENWLLYRAMLVYEGLGGRGDGVSFCLFFNHLCYSHSPNSLFKDSDYPSVIFDL